MRNTQPTTSETWTNGYPVIDLNHRWHFTITPDLSDRRILILIMPRLLNFIVAIYLIVIGLVGVFHL